MLKMIRSNLRIADILLIVSLLLISIGMLIAGKPLESSLQLIVLKDGVQIGEFPLNVDREVIIDEHNTLVIKAGRYSMKYSDCPGKRCMKQGWTNRLPIICLPNRVSIEVRESNTEPPLMLY